MGYGDLTPKTGFGRFIASVMMLVGWGTLAVPTGIVSAEFTALRLRPGVPTTRTCQVCLSEGHEPGARFCKDCGAPLQRYFTDLVAAPVPRHRRRRQPTRRARRPQRPPVTSTIEPVV